MFEKLKLRFAAILFRHAFPLYRLLYFRYKRKKDKHHLELIQRILKPGSIVIDIGANIGFFTKFLSGCVGEKGHVYAFEPDKTNFHHLKNELKGSTNTTIVQKAVSATSGKLTLYTSDLLNVDHRTYEPENYRDKYSVEKTSVDDFVNGRFKVDFIKMDIQGFEMEALKGMENTLRNNNDIVLLMELWPYGLLQAGSSVTEVVDFIAAIGLNIYSVHSGFPVLFSKQDAKEIPVVYFSDTNVLLTRKAIPLNQQP